MFDSVERVIMADGLRVGRDVARIGGQQRLGQDLGDVSGQIAGQFQLFAKAQE